MYMYVYMYVYICICMHIGAYTYNLLWNILTNLQARYDLFCVKSAVKPQPTNQPCSCDHSMYCVNVFSLSFRVLSMFAAKYFLLVKKLHAWQYRIRVIYFSTTTASGRFSYKKITFLSRRFLPGWFANDVFIF